MRPRKLAVRSCERRKRLRQSRIVRRNVIRRETKDTLDHCRSDDRRDRHDDYDDKTKNRELILEQTTPRIAPQRCAVHKPAHFPGRQVGFGHRHLRPDVYQLVWFWFLFSSHSRFTGIARADRDMRTRYQPADSSTRVLS